MRSLSILSTALLCPASVLATGVIVRSTTCQTILAPTYTPPSVSNGWAAQLIASGLSKPRSLTFDSSGALIVLDSGVGVKRLTFIDHGGSCVEVDGEPALIVDDTSLNHGVALSKDGKTLYASNADSVFAWPYNPDSGTVTADPTTIISGMASDNQVSRTLLVSQVEPGVLVVSRGSGESEEASALSSGLGQIKAFNLSDFSKSSKPLDFDKTGHVLGWGLYNAVGIGEHPKTGGIFSLDNGADDITRDGEDIHQSNPGDELNFHGFLNGTTAISDGFDQGANYGYPLCYATWNASISTASSELTVGKQFSTVDNSTFNDTTCQKDFVAPRLTLEPHQAPLDIIFTPDGKTAYISFHGSTDKSNPVGYLIGQVTFDETSGQPTATSDSTTALVDVIRNTDNESCPSSCMRPVGLAIDSTGRLFFSSDATGEIYVLLKTSTGDATSPGTMATPTATGKSAGNVFGVNWLLCLAAATTGLLLHVL